ncbi:MAG: hypothetical protein RBJ76_00090 (plasmid) [Stenomitos frigidus ULC029]
MKDNPFKRAIAEHKHQEAEQESEPSAATVEETAPAPERSLEPSAASPKKRGRPATGKRSDDDWIGRTYYVKRETDLDIEDELLKLKRRGIDVDKSELVDLLLGAWVRWQQGENIEIQLSEITPRRKGDK